MPDVNKMELQLKSQDVRMNGLERALDSIKKSVDPNLVKRVDNLEKAVAALTAAMATKKDVKSVEQSVKDEGDKAIKAAMQQVEKANLAGKLIVLEARIKILESRVR